MSAGAQAVGESPLKIEVLIFVMGQVSPGVLVRRLVLQGLCGDLVIQLQHLRRIIEQLARKYQLAWPDDIM